MASRIVVPQFANETEEADWWYDNRHLVEQEFLEAAGEGRLKRVSVQQRFEEHKARLQATKATIDLDPEDASKAHAAAEKLGMAVDSYLRMLVHEALEKETTA